MDDNLIPTEEELDDDAFLASLDTLLAEPEESEEAEAPPKTKKAPKEPKKAKFPLTRLCAVLGAVALCAAADGQPGQALHEKAGPIRQQNGSWEKGHWLKAGYKPCHKGCLLHWPHRGYGLTPSSNHPLPDHGYRYDSANRFRLRGRTDKMDRRLCRENCHI